MQLSSVDWAIFLGVPVVAWLIVVISRRKTGQLGTYRGFFLAQGTLSTGSVFATYIGANLTFTSIFLILSQEALHRGWWVLAVPVGWLIGTALFLFVYRKIHPHILAERTLHQTIGLTFRSERLQKWAAIWTIVAFVGTVALEFYGGILLLRWTGLSTFGSVAIVLTLAFVVAAFTITGGMRGVGVADMFLDVVTGAALLILLWFLLPELDVPGTLKQDFSAPPTGENTTFIVGMLILFVPFQFCTLDSWQRLLAWNKSHRNPYSWLPVGGALLAIAYCVPIAIGVWARENGIQPSDTTQPLKEFMTVAAIPAYLLGLCFAGLAGAMLSTADELLSCSSLTLLADLLNIPLTKKAQEARSSADNARLGTSGQFYTAVFGFVAAAIALVTIRFEREIRELALAVFSAQIVFAWPLAVALFSPTRAPRLARPATIAMGIAGASAIGLVIVGWLVQDKALSDGAPIAAFLIAGLLLGIPWLVDRIRNRVPVPSPAE